MWCDCESLNVSYHQMFICLMMFSLGKFTHNTISRLIKNLFQNFFFQNFFSLKLFLFFIYNFYFSFQNFFFQTLLHATFSCNIHCATRSCNSSVKLVHATRSFHFFRETHSCNFSYNFTPFLVNVSIFHTSFHYFISFLLN